MPEYTYKYDRLYAIIKSCVTFNYTSMNTRVYLQIYVFITYKWNYLVNF